MAQSELIYRLSWFELQISPNILRLSAMSQQPILLTKESVGDVKGSVLLVDKKRNPTGYEMIYEKLDRIITKLEIMELPQCQTQKCFNKSELRGPGVHIRIRYADDRRWASFYTMEDTPPQIAELIEASRRLIGKVFTWGGEKVSRERALNSLKETTQSEEKNNSSVILKVKLNLNGEILLNGKLVVWSDFLTALDNLAKAKGVLWYTREAPKTNPDADLEKKIKAVLDEIVKRKLSIKLFKTVKEGI